MVVPDVDRAMSQWTASAGYRWAPRVDIDVRVIEPGGRPRVIRSTATYSMEGPVHLELLQVRSGKPWEHTDPLHHVGYWVDGLEAALDRCRARGWRVGWTGADDNGTPARFAYVSSDDVAARVELVDRVTVGPAFERWLRGEAYEPVGVRTAGGVAP
jgi:hypothetical protein